MQKASRVGKRTLVKRSSAVNLYTDQAIQIQAIMEAVGSRKEAPIIRELVDEALAARRRKSVRAEPEPPPSSQDYSETLHTIQTLLLKLIRQDATVLRAQDIGLLLLQEILAEASAGRRFVWNGLEAPALREEGLNASEIKARLIAETNQAKDYAYGLAEEIRKQQEAKANQTKRGNSSDQLPFEQA
jgi:hypothetical protein